MAWSILEEDRHRWPTISTDKKEKGLAKIEAKAKTGTSGIGPWSESFAPGGYGQTLSTTGIGPWKSGEAYASALKGESAAKGTGAIGKAVISAAVQHLLNPEPKREQPGASANIGAGNEPALRQRMRDEENWLGPLYS